MMQMNKLDELLKELCPNGVETRLLQKSRNGSMPTIEEIETELTETADKDDDA